MKNFLARFLPRPADALRIHGRIHLVLTGADGRVKCEQTIANIVTNAGRQHVIDRLQAGAAAVADYIGIGTGSTAAAAADTTLETEVARGQGTLSQPDAHTDRCVHTFAAGVGTGTITEVGRLNASSSGTLMGRAILGSSVVKTASDSLQITYDFTYAAS